MKINNINQQISHYIITSLIQNNVNNFFIAPGLRNAPITNTIYHLSKNIFSNIDERALAYNALGYSKANNCPAVLVCTSGTAILNFAPAIAEAFKTNVPLIIISADRPRELIKQNSNQTMNQKGALTNFVISETHLEINHHDINERSLSKFQDTLEQCINCKMPIHINIALMSL